MYCIIIALSAFNLGLHTSELSTWKVISLLTKSEPIELNLNEGRTATEGPSSAQAKAKVGAHLLSWEARMKAVENVICEAQIVRMDNLLKREIGRHVATIYCQKPNYAFLRVDRSPDSQSQDPSDFTTWISNGKSMFQYAGRRKEFFEFKLKFE